MNKHHTAVAPNSLSENNSQQWDIEIKPKASLFEINLKELWEYRDLLVLFVKRDFSAQYKQTILGPLWHIIQPVLTTLMFLMIFHGIANIPTDGIPPILFYISGITIWNYFASCFISTSNTFVANAGIFGKVYFPRLIIPLSVVLSNIIRFVIQFALMLILILYYSFFEGEPVHLSFYWLILPLIILMMALLGLGLGLIVSSLTTKYRDFSVLIGFSVQLLMYATPIVYPLSYINNSKYLAIIKLNPLSCLTEAFRFAVYQKGTLDFGGILYSVIFMIVVLLIGIVVFNKVEKSFMDTV